MSLETAPSGGNWQKRINRLCHIQCGLRGEAYQPIPDTVEGDGGLEGITSDGEGFQCYADQATMNVAERVRKQKKKIADDLRKLKKNSDFWKDVLGTTSLRRWYLVTPEVPDKAVLVHARLHAKKLRDEKLPFIDSSFEAFVVTDQFFQQAIEWSERMGLTVIDYTADQPSATDYATIESKFIANTERKLRKVRPNDDQYIKEQRDRYLRWHLECQNILGKLLTEKPDLWERVEAFCTQEEETVKFESSLDPARPNQRLVNVRQALSQALERDFGMLGKTTIGAIALGMIAGWLGICSLDFLDGNGQ
jgi:hypothetical protein